MKFNYFGSCVTPPPPYYMENNKHNKEFDSFETMESYFLGQITKTALRLTFSEEMASSSREETRT